MYIHNLDPVLFDFGFFELRWYSLAYIFGILIGWWVGKKIINLRLKNINSNLKIEEDTFDDLITYIIISIILGGRLGYVIFYNLSYYLNNPLDILKIWQGGMSFHGALIGIILGTYYFSKFNSTKTFFFLDVIACVAPIGLFFGRIANFINAELYGKPTNVFWSVIFPKVDNVSRHPSQLYEAALEGLVLFCILILILNFYRKIKIGIMSSIFLITYGIFRIFIEQFREPDTHIGYILNNFSLGSVLSVVMILFGTYLFFRITKNEEYK